MNLKSLLSGFPPLIQYVVIIGVVMLLLYLCLALTRWIGSRCGEKLRYDDPESYERQTPDPHASNWFKRKPKSAGGKNDAPK